MWSCCAAGSTGTLNKINVKSLQESLTLVTRGPGVQLGFSKPTVITNTQQINGGTCL